MYGASVSGMQHGTGKEPVSSIGTRIVKSENKLLVEFMMPQGKAGMKGRKAENSGRSLWTTFYSK